MFKEIYKSSICILFIYTLIHPDYEYLFTSTTTGLLLLVTTVTQIYRITTKICFHVIKMK